MADPQTVIEGTLKYRDNKKWKPRWCVIRKLSPVADCLHLQLYRDSKDRCKNGPTKASLSMEGFLGMETGFTLDKESNTMALICTEVVVVLAFDSRELLIQWQVKVRANLVEEHQFLVQIAHVPVKSKLASGPARLHLLDYMFCLTAGVPPKLLGIWPLRELRRFGVVDGKFCFEGGSRCGKGEGLHVLLTNQAKDLVQAFDMASRGRLPGKRKVSVRKNTSGAECNSHSSLTGSGNKPCSGAEGSDNDKINSETCSSESSTKPLLSSSSDGSDPGQKGVRPCHFHYRWPSCIVPCRTARGDLTGEDGAKTIARSTVGSHGRASDGQMLWAVGHCQGCGVHYCRRNGAHDKENAAPSGDEPTGFTPQWTMDLGIVSPSKDGTPSNVQTRTCSRNRTKASPHDRSSLCSQSSQSSGTSTGSNTSSSSSSSMSEYSVPKNCLEAFYDRPKNLHHQSSSGPSFPYNRMSLTEEKDRLGPIREGGPCTCWKQQKTTDPASHELLLFGGGLLCSCWGKSNVDVDMPSVSSSGSSNASPSTSPKKQIPLVSVPILLPCTCGKIANNPYLNYAVPRSGAPVKSVKEELAEKASSSSSTSEAAENQETKIINKMDNANIPAEEKESNGNLVGTSAKPPQPSMSSSYYQQPLVCSCQKLLLCPGSLLPPLNQVTPTDSSSGRKTLGRNSSEYGSVNPKTINVSSSDNENSKRRIRDHNLNCRCRQPPVVSTPDCCCGKMSTLGMPLFNSFGSRVGRKDNANHIYVNLKYLQETAAAALSSQGVPGKLIPYYANLHFLQTLSLYENADALDLRPNQVISNIFPDGSIPEDLESTVPKRPKKKIETPSSNGVYEMMSFNQSEFPPSTSGDNYLLMQPGTLENKGELITSETSLTQSTSSQSSSSSTLASNPCASGSSDAMAEGEVSESMLPLRPFMPVLLPFHDITCDMKEHAECDETCKVGPDGRKCSGDHPRSNSLGDIKVSILRRVRSSSTDGRHEGGCSDDIGSCPHTCGTASPKSTPRKHSILSKLTLRSKEKSFSTDEITPPSSAPSSPDSLFLESIQKYPFHRSADCLQLNEEYRLSEEDLSQDPEVIMSQSMDKSCSSRGTSSIKRSSSVPCKSNPNNPQNSASSTDSSISNHIPSALGGQGAVFSHFIAYHGSLPRRHSGNAASRHPVPDRKLTTSAVNKPQIEQKPSLDQSKMILISECKQCHQFLTSPEGVLVLDAKSMTSSSSSDMSDYIESLSLCSRSSSGSGSSGCGGIGVSEYVRNEDICGGLMKIPTSCTSSLRPRSGKEYHSFDRVLIQDGCPYIPLTECAHLNLSCLKSFQDESGQHELTEGMMNDNAPESNANNNVIINNNANKTNSPSPGYVSSSPGNQEYISSPEKTTKFTFPKDNSTKELNYLEVVSVGESEPSSPVVKQGSVQYAVIDVVATAAARKLSTERAQLRNEGRSPTPTECSPKHKTLEDSCGSDKK